MSESLRRYRTIWNTLAPCYPQHPQGNLARRLHTLAALIRGIVGSRSAQLPHIASNMPEGKKAESRVKRLARWVNNDKMPVGFLP